MFAGMGASTLFVLPQARAFGEAMIVPSWPAPRAGESVAAYAERWAGDLSPRLPRGRPLVLAGVSFGGMIAQEMAHWLCPRAVLLIASARSCGGVAPFWRGLERLVSPVPWRLAEPLAPLIGYAHGLQMRLSAQDRRLLARVARRLDLTTAQWCARGVTHWPGLPTDRLARLPPVHQIHGDLDPLMPLHRVSPGTVVRGGRHHIHLGHAGEVNAWLRDRVQRVIEDAPAAPVR